MEHSSFTPLVLGATGGLGNEASVLYRHFASLPSQKWTPYNTTQCWLRMLLGLLSYAEVPGPPIGMQLDLHVPWTWSPQSQGSQMIYESPSILLLIIPFCRLFCCFSIHACTFLHAYCMHYTRCARNK